MAKVPEKKKVEVKKEEVVTQTTEAEVESKVESDPNVETTKKPVEEPKESKKPKEPETVTKPTKETAPTEVKKVSPTYAEVKGVDAAMVQYIDKYKDILKKNNITMSIKALSNIFAYVLSKPTNANLECLYVWFNTAEDQKYILTESVIFQGINKVGIKIRSKMEVMYTIFRDLTATKRRNVSLEKAREYLPEEIITWVAKKKKSK
jgi:hypothetical protein